MPGRPVLQHASCQALALWVRRGLWGTLGGGLEPRRPNVLVECVTALPVSLPRVTETQQEACFRPNVGRRARGASGLPIRWPWWGRVGSGQRGAFLLARARSPASTSFLPSPFVPVLVLVLGHLCLMEAEGVPPSWGLCLEPEASHLE